MVAFVTLSMGSTIREERDACDQVYAGFDECTEMAYENYAITFENGNDGRPDWLSRKRCNYIKAAVEDCGNKLIGDCASEEEVTAKKDHLLKKILVEFQNRRNEWQAEMCPTVKEHMDRMKAEKAGGGNKANIGGELWAWSSLFPY
eukprot:TRINITY_DN24811_c0_g1_i1.p1 TRINITY_DN24811_c0_g1~~TRINITY_DN24811_c0_g1_i1.p1  ORF type:complete len:163 (-),score=38.52 TRINITY_DN24811_c0_g1_i1:109-546(-)